MRYYKNLEPSINKWMYIRTKNGEVLRARFLKGNFQYEGWYVKNHGEKIGRVYSQKELQVAEYTQSEHDQHWKPYHTREELKLMYHPEMEGICIVNM